MLALRRGLGLGAGSLTWLEDWCTDTSLAYLNGTTAVLMNVGHEPLELPAGEVLLRSSPSPEPDGAAHRLSSGETVWLEIYIEDTES
jgi:alpha-glucosidase